MSTGFNVITLAWLILATPSHPASAGTAEKLRVVASFSILGDMAARIGGDHIELVTLVGPDGDAHAFTPRPSDAQVVGKADLMVVNGLGFEGWLGRLVEASGSKARIVVAAENVRPLETLAGHDQSESQGSRVDPHAWQDVRNAIDYVTNITRALCNADRPGCENYKANGATYVAELEALDIEIRRAIDTVPHVRRTVISNHDAFGYFERAYAITFLAPKGVSTEAEASAADIAKLIRQIKAGNASAIFLENITDPRLIEQIGRDTGMRPSGPLYSDALSDPSGPAATYVDMMRHNVGALIRAMTGS